MKKLLTMLAAIVLLSAVLAAAGCGSTPNEPTVSYSNVPEAYWNLFDGGSFDENNVWTTDDSRYSEMTAELKAHCMDKEYIQSI